MSDHPALRFDARQRSGEAEWMDADTVSPADMAACLRDLATVNTVTLARLPTVAFMRRMARRHPGQTMRVLDVGCGEGDMLRRLERWAARAGHRFEWVGLDLSAPGIAAARAVTPPASGIEYRVGSIFDPALETFDVVISSLFTHHLPGADVVRFIRVMERHARLGWFINDLHRHPVAFHGFRALSTLAGWHRFVRHDGPVSVARAFRRADWTAVLAAAGVCAEVRWHLPFRYGITRFR